jgi:cysteine-rich repeat protein
MFTQFAALRHRKVFIFLLMAALVSGLFFVLQNNEPAPLLHDGIPLPFGSQGSNLQGKLTFVTRRNSFDIYDVTFNNDEVKETLQQDRIYLVHVPNRTDIVDEPLDRVMFTALTSVRHVNYYGYKYSSASAMFERRDIYATKFKDRFPGQFFASAKAREEDAANGNSLTAFAQLNAVTLLPTSGPNAVRLDPTGSLYVFIVNETDGAKIAVRNAGVCGDGLLDVSEDCDDGNTEDGDTCNNACEFPPPIPYDLSGPGTKLGLAVQTIAPAGVVSRGDENVKLLRIDVGAVEDVRLSKLTLAVHAGDFLSADHYSLWKDADGNGQVETVLQSDVVPANGLLTFTSFGSTNGQLIVGNSSMTFEVIANITDNAPSSTLQLRIADDQPGYVGGHRVATNTPLAGIRTNDVCTEEMCQISVLNRDSILYTIRDSDPMPDSCGNGEINPHGPDGIDGNIDDEQCDDDDTDTGDGCSDVCAVEPEFVCTNAADAPTTCVSYLDYVKALADTNTDGTISGDEEQTLALAVAEAPDQPYDDVDQYDINRNGVVDNADVSIILEQLSILNP